MWLKKKKPATKQPVRLIDHQGRYVPLRMIERVWSQPVPTTLGTAGYQIMVYIGGTQVDTICLETIADPDKALAEVLSIIDSL